MNRREFLAATTTWPLLPQEGPSVSVRVLGTAQDGGYPQVGTYDERNDRARRDPTLNRLVASLAILNNTDARCYLVDATPQLPLQLDSLRRYTFVGRRASRDLLDGILLTHAHMGHYTGLMYLGLEAMDAQNVPVFGTKRMADFLSTNGPWNYLIKRGQIVPKVVEPESEVALDRHLRFKAHLVPHRDEYTDTVGFTLIGPRKKLFYLPDVDRWTDTLTEIVSSVDLALLDGTFFDDYEIPGVDMTRFPHPRIVRTMETLKDLPQTIYFTHLNNSNPVLDPSSDARRRVLDNGFNIAEDGMELSL